MIRTTQRSARSPQPREDNGKSLQVDEQVIELISIEAIGVDPAFNPRQRSLDIDQLAASIREYGLLQPLVVRRDPTNSARYQLVAGHRRLAAIKLLLEETQTPKWRRVPATVRGEDSDQAYVLALVENLQREDLSPREESEALARLVRERNWTTVQVAAAIKRSQSYVSKRLRVYEDKSLRNLILRQQLAPTVAEELLVAEPDRRLKLAKQAVAQGWDQKRARAEVRGYTAAFHPQLRQQIHGLREFVTHSTLSVGERELLHQFAQFVLTTVPTPEGGRTSSAAAKS